jgi:TorA maturation chaperone TorD
MAGLANGHLPGAEESSRTIFESHMAPWMGRFFGDLERAESADFYRQVGTVGRVFIGIETEAFTLPLRDAQRQG